MEMSSARTGRGRNLKQHSRCQGLGRKGKLNLDIFVVAYMNLLMILHSYCTDHMQAMIGACWFLYSQAGARRISRVFPAPRSGRRRYAGISCSSRTRIASIQKSPATSSPATEPAWIRVFILNYMFCYLRKLPGGCFAITGIFPLWLEVSIRKKRYGHHITNINLFLSIKCSKAWTRPIYQSWER